RSTLWPLWPNPALKMTTAHKPTWNAAQGGASDMGNWSIPGGGTALAARLQPAHKKLKFRQSGQNSESDLKRRDLKAALEEKVEEEEQVKQSGMQLGAKPAGPQLLLKQAGEVDMAKVKKFDDADDEDSESELESSDDDSDDDEEALQRELAKIREEREDARKAKELEEEEEKAIHLREAAMTGNALLNQDADGSSQLKRRWNDDVVFKGQARTEPEKKKRFVNDTIR
ncbi:unnamed protein product, partial [Chrysoparadoxa australica]